MTFRADDVEASSRDNFLMLLVDFGIDPGKSAAPLLRVRLRVIDIFFPQNVARKKVRVAAQKNVGSAAGHIGCDRYCAFATRLGDDLRFLLMVLGVQYHVFYARALEQTAEFFRAINGNRADKHR